MTNGANPHVTQIILRSGGDIEVTVQVAGFPMGTTVEISGYAMQENGGLAKFDGTEKVTKNLDELVVTTPSGSLVPGQGVITFTRLSLVWSSVLKPDQTIVLNPGDTGWTYVDLWQEPT